MGKGSSIVWSLIRRLSFIWLSCIITNKYCNWINFKKLGIVSSVDFKSITNLKQFFLTLLSLGAQIRGAQTRYTFVNFGLHQPLLGRYRGKKFQNDKKFCLSCLIFQEPYIIRSSFMVHMCKSIIFPNIFFCFFKILNFGMMEVWGRGVKGQKVAHNDKQFCLSRSIS